MNSDIKNLIINNFRLLKSEEINSVNGGLITVTGSNINSLTPEDLALVNETLGSPVIVVSGTLGQETDPFDDEGTIPIG